jgi:hypothetical protein
MKSRISLLAAALCVAGLTAGPATAQPAPGLTQYRVVGVASPQYMGGQKWDPVAPGAVITTGDHGGAWLLVAVYEEGYANGQNSVFNTVTMSLYSSQALYNSNNQIYGWIRYYHLPQPFTGGRFTSSANSLGVPFGTKSTGLTIR